MGFIKVIKSNVYFKRFQVKFARRRSGQTDYQQRRALVIQSKNKYNTPKYRLVVRFTKKNVTAQIAYSKIDGDHILCAAYSAELPKYGMKVGLTNYTAGYATGLLLARRLLTKLKIGDAYKGIDANGEEYNIEDNKDGPKAFRAYLDIGVARATTGAKIFSVLKGAVDGGLSIPHSVNRFAGYDTDAKKLDTKVHRSYLYGGHVAGYMEHLMEEDADMYKKQFAMFIKAKLTPDNMEKTWKTVYANIRKDPSRKKSDKPVPKDAGKRYNKKALSQSQRKDKIKQKQASFLKKKNASADVAAAE